MEYKARRRYTAVADVNGLSNDYPHDIQMYDVPPVGETSLEEFQELGFDRLKGKGPYQDPLLGPLLFFIRFINVAQYINVAALRLMETTNSRGDLKTLEERKKAFGDSLKSDGLRYYMDLLYADGSNPQSEDHSQTRRKDHISHFILRLVYCRDIERAMWFVNQEIEFFKLKFSSLDKKGVEHLLSINNLDCVPVRFIILRRYIIVHVLQSDR